MAAPVRLVTAPSASAESALAATGPPSPARPRLNWLGAVPVLTLSLFFVPILLGLAGTWAPAFGILPALGGESLTVEPWRRLWAAPGLGSATLLSIATGLAATAISLGLALYLSAAWHGTAALRATRRILAPLLAVPHAALALGLAFLLASSGWIVRLAGGAAGLADIDLWTRPPAFAPVQDPYGIALTLGLVLKETPFLMLMIIAALGQVDAGRALATARSVGYGPVTAWFKVILPQIYPQIRLPIYAVLAFSVSVVDVALILAPVTPPPLAVLVMRWFNDPDLSLRFVAAAGACLQLLVVIVVVALWRLMEHVVGLCGRRWLWNGRRGTGGRAVRAATGTAWGVAVGLSLAALAGMALWSIAHRWRFPDVLPSTWTLGTWQRALPSLAEPAWTTAVAAVIAAVIAVALTIGCLEHEKKAGIRPTGRAMWLLYTPLLVPQIAFLFGLQVLLAAVRLDGTWIALIWSHLLFVLPYVFLSLSDPWRSLDDRYIRTARCLGASPGRVFWRIKLPMLLRPVLFAAAIGIAVSVAQYLPTLFAGAGRFTTLTTEAVGLAAGADRRVIGVYAFAQMAVPLIAFALAIAVPALLFRHRQGMAS